MAANDIARVYAQSLVEVGLEKKVLSSIEEEMKFLSDLISKDKDVRQFFASPAFSKESKISFVQKVFGGSFSQHVINLLNVLIENDRQSLVVEINDALIRLIDEANNKMSVTVISASSMDGAMREKIKSALSGKYKKEIILDEKIDEAIIGGIIIQIGDLVIDGSLAKDLKNIRKNLLISKVRSEAAYED